MEETPIKKFTISLEPPATGIYTTLAVQATNRRTALEAVTLWIESTTNHTKASKKENPIRYIYRPKDLTEIKNRNRLIRPDTFYAEKPDCSHAVIYVVETGPLAEREPAETPTP